MSDFRDKLIKMIDTVQDLPTLPQICFELERILAAASSGAEDVAMIIERDVSLSTTILKTANSAYFLTSSSGSIESVRAAVARLGFREVGDIIRTVEIIRAFKGKGPHLDHERFWKHNLMVGTAARFIHQSAGTSAFDEEEAYLAGLLHDIGKLILDQYYSKEFLNVHEVAEAKSIQLHLAEQEILGIDHCEVGELFLRHWELPSPVIESVRWHHQPSLSPEEFRGIATLVALANVLVLSAESDPTGERVAAIARAAGWKSIGIQESEVTEIFERVKKDFRGSAALLGLL